MACVASQALAGSVVRFPRPTCLNDDDEDKKKGGRLFLGGRLLRAVSRCTLGERVCCVCVRARRCRSLFLLFACLCLLHIRKSLCCLVVLVAQRW